MCDLPVEEHLDCFSVIPMAIARTDPLQNMAVAQAAIFMKTRNFQIRKIYRRNAQSDENTLPMCQEKEQQLHSHFSSNRSVDSAPHDRPDASGAPRSG
jgi:precorrin-2 methylase